MPPLPGGDADPKKGQALHAYSRMERLLVPIFLPISLSAHISEQEA